MQSASTNLQNAIKQNYSMDCKVQVIAEWNLNRYVDSSNVFNGALIGSATITVISPDPTTGLGTASIQTSVNHGLALNDQVRFGSVVSTLGLQPNVDYYVISVPSANTLLISATILGPSLPITNAGSSPQIYAEIEDYDSDLFPISSIALPDRPVRGILKARASSAARVAGVGADGFATNGYVDTPAGARYMTADPLSKYKYWTSPEPSAGPGYSVTPSALANTAPTIVYSELMQCNKIRVGFESSYAKASAYTIQISTDAATWTTISTSPTIPDSGQVNIYHQGDGTWNSTVYRDNPMQIMGIRLVVTQMNMTQVFMDLIELSPRLESDISARVIDYKITNTMSETSFISPLGKASANTGTVTLSNVPADPDTDQFTGPPFNNFNPASLYYGLLDKNVEIRLSQGTNTGTYAAPSYEWIRLATMKTDTWDGQSLDTTVVAMADDAMRLQGINPNPVFYESMTVGEIIWRILDSIGFNNYHYEARSDDPSTLVPYFWTDGTKTVWEVFNELTQATQTALFFNEYCVLQIRTRNAAMDPTRTLDWTLNGATSGTTLADIVDIKKTYSYEANTVDVQYLTTTISTETNDIPVMESVWDPGGDLVLRAVALKTTMPSTAVSGQLEGTDLASWPFTGIIEIEGEFIRYVSKEYSYYNTAGHLTASYVTTQDQVVALDKLYPLLAYKNAYSGWLYFGPNNRGLWNSVPKTHNVDISGYTGKYRTKTGGVYNWNGGIYKNDTPGSIMRMKAPPGSTGWTWYIAGRGDVADQPPVYYGTRFRLPAGPGEGTAGIAMGLGTYDSGYFVELTKTASMGARTTQNELLFYTRYPSGLILANGPNGNKGVVMQIDDDIWHDLDVHIVSVSGGYNFSIAIDGITHMNTTVSSAHIAYGGALTGRFGLFVRGSTIADFEYLYASTLGVNDAFDDGGWFDRISGGYQSSQMMQEWTYSLRTATKVVKGRKQAYTQKYNNTFMDDFGPIVHEVREFDVKFTKTPVLHSRIYLSNETQIICPEYNGNPFGAKFILANIARTNAVSNGSDTLMFGANNPVNQNTLIYGRTVTQAAVATYSINDILGVSSKGIRGVNRRGAMTVTVASPWLQSLAAATAVGNWIMQNWSTGQDEVVVTAFGNPLLQLGDLVGVNFPLLNMAAADSKYFVVGIANTFNAGLETSLTLRRANI